MEGFDLARRHKLVKAFRAETLTSLSGLPDRDGPHLWTRILIEAGYKSIGAVHLATFLDGGWNNSGLVCFSEVSFVIWGGGVGVEN